MAATAGSSRGFWAVLLGLLAPLIAGQQAPSVWQFNTAVGVETKSVDLACHVTNKGSLDSVFWYLERDGGAVILGQQSADYASYYPKYELVVQLTEGWYNLTVNSLSVEDGGVFECLVVHGSQTVSGDPGVLEVLPTLAPPSGPTCSADFDGPLTEGEAISARCVSADGGRPESTLTWLDGSGLPVGDPSESELSLSRPAGAGDHGAVYTCSETHTALNGTRSCTVGPLSVLHAPVVTITPAYPRAASGDEVVLNCSALANPALQSLRWTFGDVAVANDTSSNASEARVAAEEGLDVNGVVAWSRLIIDEVVEADFGVRLTCSGRNAIGDGRATAVLRPPDPVPDDDDDGGGGGIIANNPALVIAIDLAALGALIMLGLCFMMAPKCKCLVCDCCRARKRREKKRRKGRGKRRRTTARTGHADTAVDNPTYSA